MTIKKSSLLAVAAALLLAGCSASPDYSRPLIKVPATWSFGGNEQAPTPPALAGWWKAFDDPVLDALVAKASSGNLGVAAAKARVDEARATLKQSGASLFPSASGSAMGSRSKANGNVGNNFQAGLDASWEIDLFGANRRNREAAKFGLDAAQEDLRSAKLTMIGDIATNYIAARGYQARRALAAKSADLQRRTLDITRDKVAAGASSPLDVANAEGLTLGTEANIPQLVASYAAAVNRISILTGEAPGAVDAAMEKGAGRVPRASSSVKSGVPGDLLHDRPDVRIAEQKLNQAKARHVAANAARYPSVSLTGSIATGAAEIGDLAKGSSIGWSFGPSVSVPVFNAGKLKAAAEVAKAQESEAFIAYKSSVLSALEDVENSAVSLNQERRRSSKLAQSAEAYEKAADLSRTLYSDGATSFIDVLTAERSVYSAQDTAIQSRVALATYFVALNKALGGGWNGEANAK